MSLRVLVADDSILFRRVIAEVLRREPDVEVVGSVGNGKLALQRVQELKPDLLTLDLEMPEMDGLAVLEALRRSNDPMKVVVISSLTPRGGKMTMRALDLGAFDFITKPDAGSADASREAIRAELSPIVRMLKHQLSMRAILRRPTSGPTAAAPAPAPTPAAARSPAPAKPLSPQPVSMRSLLSTGGGGGQRPAELVLIGVSTGGPKALMTLLPELPGDLGAPVLIVQHMPPVFTASLASSLGERCALKVVEAAHGDRVAANTVYIAPGGRQMGVAGGGAEGLTVRISDDPPENNCRPAVDFLFRSVSQRFAGRSVATILTGMGDDGARGLQLLKPQGCLILAQDEASSVVFGMPRAAVEAGVVDEVLPLAKIASRITAAVRSRHA
ncbi:MAG: chemotaxis response regulator protein-glutamate methylesterase [Myxococcales bacterium]